MDEIQNKAYLSQLLILSKLSPSWGCFQSQLLLELKACLSFSVVSSGAGVVVVGWVNEMQKKAEALPDMEGH